MSKLLLSIYMPLESTSYKWLACLEALLEIKMKHSVILILAFLLASCSAVWKSEFLILAPLEGALEVEIYNWETELYGGPSFGYVRPKVYGYKLDDAYYFVYPREIYSSGTVGPPLIPLGFRIPELSNDKHSLFIFRVFDPKKIYPEKPTKMSILDESGLQLSCDLSEFFRDSVGIDYRCSEKQEFPNNRPSKVVIELSNQHRFELPIKSVVVRGYSPLFSFNGPNPEPKVVIHREDGSITYPK